MKTGKKKNLSNLLDALGDRNRLGIVLFLANGEKCVCEIFRCLKLPQNLVSHHLGILRKNKLLVNRKEGRWVYYSINKKRLKELQNLFANCCGTQAKNKCKNNR